MDCHDGICSFTIYYQQQYPGRYGSPWMVLGLNFSRVGLIALFAITLLCAFRGGNLIALATFVILTSYLWSLSYIPGNSPAISALMVGYFLLAVLADHLPWRSAVDSGLWHEGFALACS